MSVELPQSLAKGVELLPQSVAEADARGWDPRLTNADIMPNPLRKRTWTAFNFGALWMGMIHNMVAFSIVGGMIAVGYSGVQTLIVIGIGSIIQLGFLAITGRVGSRFGLNFAVWARAAFGPLGANVPALLRAITAIAYVGVQVFLAGGVINVGLGAAFSGWAHLGRHTFDGVSVTMWLSMGGFWLLHFVIIRHGMDTIRRFENWAGPMVMAVMIPLTIWAITKAHGLGPVFRSTSKYHGVGDFLTLGFVSGVALFISGSWATLILNYPDLTRFARSNRQQLIGTLVGFPLASVLFYGMVAIIVSTVEVFGHSHSWVPADVLLATGSKPFIIIGAILLFVATLSVNVAANLVSPAYDLANALPRWLTFKKAAVVALIIAVAYNPWKLMQNPNTLFNVLDYFGAALGPATGVLVADYLFVRKRRIDVDALYRWNGRYRAWRGFNIVGLAAMAVATALALTGAVFPSVGFLFKYGWFVGVACGFIVYLAVVGALRTWWPRPLPEFEAVGTKGTELDEADAGMETSEEPVLVPSEPATR